jgi:hypothetical protein
VHGRWKKLRYKVKYKGYEEALWQPVDNVIPGAEEEVAAFHRRNPTAAGPPVDFEWPPEESPLEEETNDE